MVRLTLLRNAIADIFCDFDKREDETRFIVTSAASTLIYLLSWVGIWHASSASASGATSSSTAFIIIAYVCVVNISCVRYMPSELGRITVCGSLVIIYRRAMATLEQTVPQEIYATAFAAYAITQVFEVCYCYLLGRVKTRSKLDTESGALLHQQDAIESSAELSAEDVNEDAEMMFMVSQFFEFVYMLCAMQVTPPVISEQTIAWGAMLSPVCAVATSASRSLLASNRNQGRSGYFHHHHHHQQQYSKGHLYALPSIRNAALFSWEPRYFALPLIRTLFDICFAAVNYVRLSRNTFAESTKR